MNPLTQSTNITILPVLIALALGCFELSPDARAVCQEGCLTNDNTVLGDDALLNNTGISNTAIGASALSGNTIGPFNTAIGSGALQNNTTGDNNTASGAEALFSNTMGIYNTATGADALYSNTSGDYNTANGLGALFSNTTGFNNTANGLDALFNNTTGFSNAANGIYALFNNTTGNFNTATGVSALYYNTTGSLNTANGYKALDGNTTGNYNTANGQGSLFSNTTGNNNTGTGFNALFNNTTGNTNIAVGDSAGSALTTGNNNIDIGNAGVAGEAGIIRLGTAGTQTATFIAGIRGVPIAGGMAIGVDPNGQLGVRGSSARFKEAIKPMDKASEAIFSLQPVTFRYKKAIDPVAQAQFGLVAEQVAKVDPDLVISDEKGKPFSVRYEEVNAMLLNEFLKEHRTVQGQQKEIDALKAEMKEQKALIQKVSAQIELSKPELRTVLDNQ